MVSWDWQVQEMLLLFLGSRWEVRREWREKGLGVPWQGVVSRHPFVEAFGKLLQLLRDGQEVSRVSGLQLSGRPRLPQNIENLANSQRESQKPVFRGTPGFVLSLLVACGPGNNSLALAGCLLRR